MTDQGLSRRALLAGAPFAAVEPGSTLREVEVWSAVEAFVLDDVIAPRDERVVEIGEAIPRRTDRWGRAVGVIRMADGTTLQERLVAEGRALVRPTSDDPTLIQRLYAAEDGARTAKRGAWSDGRFRVYDAATGYVPFNGFRILSGAVLRAEKRKGRIYFNFGDDYRTDVTVSLTEAHRRRWRAPLEELLSLAGALVEARGWIISLAGPSLELDHPLAIRRV